MFAPLSMSKIRAVVLVDSQTEATLEATNVVLEEVWILVEVDRL